MKFVFDKKLGTYIPENFAHRFELSDVDRAVFDWLDANPELPERLSFSTRSIAYRFLADNQEFSGKDLESIRDAIAKWNNSHTPLMPKVQKAKSTKVDPNYTEEYRGAIILADTATGEGYQAFYSNNLIASAPTVSQIKNSLDKYFKGLEEKEKDKLNWTFTRSLNPAQDSDLTLARLAGYPLSVSQPLYEYKDSKGFLHYSPTLVAVEEAAGAPAAAPVSGAPVAVDALSISCPVLPKKKRGAKEGLKGYDAKGDCFRVAWDTFYEKLTPTARLCHGVVTGQGSLEGVKFVHAWVEDGDTVIDKTIPLFANGFPKDAYYKIGRIDDALVFRYDTSAVANNASDYGTYGPWEDVLWEYAPE